MNEPDESVRDLVRRSIQPVDAELKRDLWPRMRARMETQPVRVPWWDWALAGGLAACLLAFPSVIPVLIYHL